MANETIGNEYVEMPPLGERDIPFDAARAIYAADVLIHQAKAWNGTGDTSKSLRAHEVRTGCTADDPDTCVEDTEQGTCGCGGTDWNTCEENCPNFASQQNENTCPDASCDPALC